MADPALHSLLLGITAWTVTHNLLQIRWQAWRTTPAVHLWFAVLNGFAATSWVDTGRMAEAIVWAACAGVQAWLAWVRRPPRRRRRAGVLSRVLDLGHRLVPA